MELVKYLTNSHFDNEKFSSVLNSLNIQAKPIKNGVILDREAFNSIPVYELPHWLYINRQYIDNAEML